MIWLKPRSNCAKVFRLKPEVTKRDGTKVKGNFKITRDFSHEHKEKVRAAKLIAITHDFNYGYKEDVLAKAMKLIALTHDFNYGYKKDVLAKDSINSRL